MFAIFGRTFSGRKGSRHSQAAAEPSFIALLYEQYKAFLFQKAALYTDDFYTREDIVQNTVLRLMRNEEKLRTLDPPALATYLALTVRSAALNYIRSESRDGLNALPLDEVEDERLMLGDCAQLTLEEQMLLGHRDDEIHAAIGRLSERDQAALQGKYFLELDSKELAQLLGVTPSTLRMVLSRARSRALEELKKEGIVHG